MRIFRPSLCVIMCLSNHNANGVNTRRRNRLTNIIVVMKSTKQFNAEAFWVAGALVAPESRSQWGKKGTDPGGMARGRFECMDNP